jgi:hypothetical protein
MESRYFKVVCSLVCLIVLASNLWTMRSWTERTGVYDDLCYLRQAHLFQRFGLSGLDTNMARDDDDHYFATAAREIGLPGWDDPTRYPCHVRMKATGKIVIQYPPGTGFLMAIFPSGFQRVPLYAVADFVIFLVALSAIWLAGSPQAVVGSTGLGALALYFMINPAKASFSIAPTMAVCALAGYLIVMMFTAENRHSRLIATTMAGLFLGLSVSFRLPNLLLSAGPLLWLSIEAIRMRKAGVVLALVIFGAAFLAGLTPTLVANAINAGSAFSTTYGADDVLPPELGFTIVKMYFSEIQGVLTVAALAWAAWGLRSAERTPVPVVVITNLVCNLAFFLSHPRYTPYYLMPVAMLSLWSLLFNGLIDRRALFRGANNIVHGNAAAQNY